MFNLTVQNGFLVQFEDVERISLLPDIPNIHATNIYKKVTFNDMRDEKTAAHKMINDKRARFSGRYIKQ